MFALSDEATSEKLVLDVDGEVEELSIESSCTSSFR